MKKVVSLLLTLLLAANISSFCSFAGLKNADIEVIRLAGKDRIGTSLEISNAGWKSSGAKTVVLANGYEFADALSGAPLAAALKAPVLLTGGKSLESDIKKQLNVLNCTDVCILGGNVAVSEQIENELLKSGYNVKRVWGSDRSETSAKIAEELLNITGKIPDSIFLAAGYNFPDALSVSSVAVLNSSPVLYIERDGSLNPSVESYILNSKCKSAIIAGGEAVVPESVPDYVLDNFPDINSVERVAGNDRYATSLAVYEKYKSLFDENLISVASGADFPDALSGVAFASMYRMPVVLVNNNGDNSKLGDKILSPDTQKLYIFGGLVAISQKTSEEILYGGERVKEHHVIRTVTINSTGCGIYADAGTEYKKLTTAVKGKSYTVIDTKDDKNGVSWFRINTGSVDGWVIRTKVSIKNTYIPIEDKVFSKTNKAVIYLSPSRQPGNLYYNKKTNEQAEMERLSASIKSILETEYDCKVYMGATSSPLVDRMEQAYELGCDIYIAIHSNASSSSGMYGTSYGARMYHFTACNQSYQLSKNLIESLNAIAPKKSNSSNQIIDGMLYLNNFGYGEVRTPADYGMVSLLAETDYHDNSITGAWLINNQSEIARAYVDGIVKTFNIPKK